MACGIALGNALEALVGTVLLQRLIGLIQRSAISAMFWAWRAAAVLRALVSASVGAASG